MMIHDPCESINDVCNLIGPNIANLSFQVKIDGGNLSLDASRFHMKCTGNENGKTVFKGRWRDINAIWEFVEGNDSVSVKLSLESENPLECIYMDQIIFDYFPKCDNVDELMLLAYSDVKAGINKISDVKAQTSSGNFLGVFENSRSEGILLTSCIPQKNISTCNMVRVDNHTLRFTMSTNFTEGQSMNKRLESESSWICCRKTVRAAIDNYSQQIPLVDPVQSPPVGWNSWDYYAQTVSSSGVMENVKEIKKDPVLSNRIKYIVLDDGWAHMWGEWYENYKFPEGLAGLAQMIKSEGFEPGIWTAPLQAGNRSITALRNPEILIKDEYGDPYVDPSFPGFYYIDPTHPEGKKYLSLLFERLYLCGFRLFKVDYTFKFLNAKRFFDKDKGPYEVIRDVFQLIREKVTAESHIIGCGLPEQCGPGCVDSGRIGVDIHNYWTHVKWVADFMQLRYWLNNRIWLNDIDCLVVRGKETSLEEETNILNPTKNNPVQPRWKGGPVFSLEEARTWANLVYLSGGSVFLGDRISMLNKKGRALIDDRLLQPAGVSAVPLDLCDSERASIWFQKLEHECRLGIINWSEENTVKEFEFGAYGIDAPKTVTDFWSGTSLNIIDGKVRVELMAHESVVLSWMSKEN